MRGYVKFHQRQTYCETVKWNQLAQANVKQQALMLEVVNIRVPLRSKRLKHWHQHTINMSYHETSVLTYSRWQHRLHCSIPDFPLCSSVHTYTLLGHVGLNSLSLMLAGRSFLLHNDLESVSASHHLEAWKDRNMLYEFKMLWAISGQGMNIFYKSSMYSWGCNGLTGTKMKFGEQLLVKMSSTRLHLNLLK